MLLTMGCRAVLSFLPYKLHGKEPGGCAVGVHVPCRPTPGHVVLLWAAEGDGVSALLLAPHAACKVPTW